MSDSVEIICASPIFDPTWSISRFGSCSSFSEREPGLFAQVMTSARTAQSKGENAFRPSAQKMLPPRPTHARAVIRSGQRAAKRARVGGAGQGGDARWKDLPVGGDPEERKLRSRMRRSGEPTAGSTSNPGGALPEAS